MSEKASQFRIGILVIVGVAIVLLALFLFGIRGVPASAPRPTTGTWAPLRSAGRELRGGVGKVTGIGFGWNLYKIGSRPCVVVRCTKPGMSPPWKVT
jgi:hypothetical protein